MKSKGMSQNQKIHHNVKKVHHDVNTFGCIQLFGHHSDISTMFHSRLINDCVFHIFSDIYFMMSKLLVISKMSNTILICFPLNNIFTQIGYFYNVSFLSYRRLCIFHTVCDLDLYL